MTAAHDVTGVMGAVLDALGAAPDPGTGSDPVTGRLLSSEIAEIGRCDGTCGRLPLASCAHRDVWGGVAPLARDWASWCGRDEGYAAWMHATLLSMRPYMSDGAFLNALCMGPAQRMARGMRVSVPMLGVLRGHDMYSLLMEHAPWPVEPIPLVASMRGAADDPAKAVARAARLTGAARPALEAIRRVGPPPVMDARTVRALSEGFTGGTGDRAAEDMVLSAHAARAGRIGIGTERLLIRDCDWSLSDVPGAVSTAVAAVRAGAGVGRGRDEGPGRWERVRRVGPDAGTLLVALLDHAVGDRTGLGAPSARLAAALAGMGLPERRTADAGGDVPLLTGDMTAAAARLLIGSGPLPLGFVLECAKAGGVGMRMVRPRLDDGYNWQHVLDLGPVALHADGRGRGGRGRP